MIKYKGRAFLEKVFVARPKVCTKHPYLQLRACASNKNEEKIVNCVI